MHIFFLLGFNLVIFVKSGKILWHKVLLASKFLCAVALLGDILLGDKDSGSLKSHK